MKLCRKSLKEKLPEMISYWENKKDLDEEAQEYLNDAKKALKNKELSNVCNSLGSVYLLAKDFDQAKTLFERAGHYAKEENQATGYAVSLINLGELHMEKGEVIEAELNFLFCSQFLQSLGGNSTLEWLLLRNSVELYIRNVMLDLAEEFVDKIIKKNKENQKYLWDSIPDWLESLMPMVRATDQVAVKEFINKISVKINKQAKRKRKKQYV